MNNAARQIHEQKMSSVFHLHNFNQQNRKHDPLFVMYQIANDAKYLNQRLHKLKTFLGKIGTKMVDIHKVIEKFLLYEMDQAEREHKHKPQQRQQEEKDHKEKESKSQQDQKDHKEQKQDKSQQHKIEIPQGRRIPLDEWVGVGQHLYRIVHNTHERLKTDEEWTNLLYLMSHVFPAEPSMAFKFKFDGELIRDDFKVFVQIGLHQVVHNLMYVQHLLFVWNSLHYTKKDCWKIWLEYYWITDVMPRFIAHVRKCIQAKIDGQVGIHHNKASS